MSTNQTVKVHSMSDDVLKLIKEAEQEVNSVISGKSAVISARYGKQAAAYYEACMAVARYVINIDSISSVFVPMVGQKAVQAVFISMGIELVEYTATASGVAPSLLDEIKKQAEIDMTDIKDTLTGLADRIKSK